ncbi:MAG: pyrroline-5-carboxylate reductase [Nitrospiraceae bacterium]
MSRKIAMIGAGQMAEALLRGLLASQVSDPARLFATDISAERRDHIKQQMGVRVGADNREAALWADIVVMAVKPQMIDAVVTDLGPVVEGKLVISIAAGVSLARIAACLPGRTPLVRVMPNAPALIREGVSALAFGPRVDEQDRETAYAMFQAVGRVVIVDETLMAAVTGLSGSGPAYVFMAIEALADGGVKMGLSRSVAELLAAQTVLGAARMLIETGEHPGRLKDRVASPGGTTIAGLHRLEQGRLRATLIEAVEAATKRAEELGRARE